MGFWDDAWDVTKGIGRRLMGGGGSRPPMSYGGNPYLQGPDPTMGGSAPTGGGPIETTSPAPTGYAGGYYGASGAPIEAPETEPQTGIGSKLWNWVKENPETILDAVGTGYGLYQQGKGQDRAYGLQERRVDTQDRRVDLEAKEQERRARERERERERRRRAYRNILEMRDEGG